jgi:GDP-L-fucose synthase
MNKDSKIYIAGHTGMVGSALTKMLKEEGYNNLVFTPYPEFDLIIQAQVDEFFKKERPDYVFLAAAKVGGIMANSTYQADFIYNNIMISSNIIYASYKHRVKKLLNLGSSCIYPKKAPQPLKEEYILSGYLESTNEPYAVAKIAAIKMCRYFNQQYRTNFISVMPTNLYGPFDNYNLEASHVLPAMIRKMHLAKCLEKNDLDSIKEDLNKRPVDGIDGNASRLDIINILKKHGIIQNEKNTNITLWGSGTPFREFLYSDDLANSLIYLMTNYDADQIGEFVNIGTGKDIMIRELSSLIKSIIEFEGEIYWDPSKPDGTIRKLLDVNRIMNKGWKYSYELEQGINEAYNWYLNN